MTQKLNHQQKTNTNQRRILPPEVDQDVTFGIMWIRVGKLKLTRGKAPLDNKVVIQFWGQKQPVLLQTKSNPLNPNQSQTMVEYDIKCPITYFKDYLMDMKKNLRLQVQDVGKVDFDITKFLKQNIDLTSRYVFDHFKGSFQILGQHNRKIGTIELQMASNFNPQLTALQLGEQDHSQNIDHEEQQNKIAKQNPQLFEQFYQSHIDSNKKDMKKQQFKEIKDDRIPNSLNTEMSAQKFNPALYLKEQQKSNRVSERKVPQPSQKGSQPSPRNVNIVMKKGIQNQRKVSQIKQPQKNQQIYNFPTIAKVLTYSNLRLTKGYQQEERNSKMKPVNGSDRKQVKIQKMEFYQYQRKNDQSENKIKNKKISQQKIFTPQQQPYSLTPQQQQFSTYQQSKRPSTPIQAISQEDVISDIKRSNPQSESNLLQDDKQILSRVVNLDQELKKSQVNSPLQNKKKSHEDSPQKIKPQKSNKISQKQNDIRPITQYNHPDLTYQKLSNQSPQMMRYPATQMSLEMKKIKPSSLILNLLVEIQTQSIKFLKKKEKFNLIHRPYGCKERIKLGPKFETEKITIMCPVSEQLVSKMDKMPFIVQFWSAVTNQFLGFIKIDLSKIKKGFMLQGRLNEIAIKSSLMPIIIQKGEIWIESVNAERSGECCIYAGIGTSAQIGLYLNTQRRVDVKKLSEDEKQLIKKQLKTDRKKVQKQQKQQTNVEDKKLDLSNADKLVTNLLQFIDMNSNKNIQELTELMRKKEVTDEEFQDFLLQINPNQQKIKEVVHIFKNYVPFIGSEQKFIKTGSLKTSFDQYKQVQQRVIKQFNVINKFIQKRLSQQTKDEIGKGSSFNIIQKQKLKQIYFSSLNRLKDSQQLYGQISVQQQKYRFEQYYLCFFEEFINTKVIFSEEKLNSYYQPSQKLIIEQVLNEFVQILLKESISMDYLQIYLKESDSKQGLDKKLCRFYKQHLSGYVNNVSLWYWVCLINGDIDISENSEQKFIRKLREQQIKMHRTSVIKEKINLQLSHENERKAFQSVSKQKRAQPLIQQGKVQKLNKNQQVNNNQSMGSISESNLHNILNQKQASQLMRDIINLNNPNNSLSKQQYPQQLKYSNVLIQKQNVDLSNSQLTHQQNKQKQTQCYQHIFQIKGLELFIQHPIDGEYLLTYTFPYQQDSISSKKIRILNNKHRYAINLYGQHTISIETDIKEYLNQIPIKFQFIQLKNTQKQNILLQGDLHCDQILSQEQQQKQKQDDSKDQQFNKKKHAQSRVVLLFNQDVQKVQGKVKLQLHYESRHSTNPTIGKQTVYNLFLPKVGFTNFSLLLKLQQQKIKSQFHLQNNQEYYISLTIDMFNQSKALKPYYPPIISQLYSNLDQEILFQTSLKLTLNPNVLSYIKENSCHVSLNLIYYSKTKGNYQKKQTTFATLKIPLFNLIQSQGISGNYAFKNKYGMFIALCKTNINYQKYQKKPSLSQSNSQISMTNNNLAQKNNKLNTYWVMINFKQLINFQTNVETTFVKFQTIINAQKYQTQKIHLSEDPLLIFNDIIIIPLSQEQFFSTKIIPISILFDQNQKYAMDINIRPILRKLSKQNYSVNGGYFLVVDENSQMTKMRVGAKVIVFKGSSLLEPFVNAYANNTNLDVLSQIDLKRDLQNYNKLLDLFRNELKLSKKTFEELLRQILVNKNEKLPLQLMTSQLLYKLDFTPIVAENEQEVDSLVRNIDGAISERKLMEFVQQNEYKLTNFHPQILTQYSFQNLQTQKIDKNVEYFNLKKQIDVLTLVRKIKVIQGNNIDDNQMSNNNKNEQQRKYRELRITIEKGGNFHYLYNGIKPNVLIKIPELSYESKLKGRSSEPLFNQSLREIVEKEKQVFVNFSELVYRNLHVQVYHVSTGRKGQQEEILIGEGKINVFSSIDLYNPRKQCQQKSVRVIISSTMSSKMKATLQIKLKLSLLGDSDMKNIKNQFNQQNQLQDASRIQDMIKDINKDMDDKRYMFEDSSDDDDY